MNFSRFIIAAAFFAGMTLVAASCKTPKKTEETAKSEAPKADSSTSPKPSTGIHPSGKIQSGTFVNGPAQDTSSGSAKPKQ